MSKLISGPDRWIYPVEVTSSTNMLRVEEDQDDDGVHETRHDLQLDLGPNSSPKWYWGHNDDSFNSKLAGLYKEVEDKLNGSGTLSGTYTVEAYTPSNSSVQASGIRIKSQTSDPEFHIDWSNSTVDPNWFGWGDSATSTVSSSSSIESPYSAISFWNPYQIFSEDTARKKMWDEERIIGTSSEDDKNAFQIQYGDAQITRSYEYEMVPGATLRAGKGLDADQAANSGLPTGDTHNALYHFWDVAAQKKEIVIVHNEGRSDLQVDSHDWERGYLTSEYRSQFSSVAELTDLNGEYYNVSFDHLITESTMPVK